QPTLDLLTNPEVIAVNQKSSDNQPHFYADNTRIWTARPQTGAGHYLALFNTGGNAMTVSFPLEALGLKTVKVRDLWARADIGTATGVVKADLPPHGAGLFMLT
ncbi:MAG: alpha-galactosidase, partial [Asticcacaulis sp.]|nr:alpha-galactosidase [Asticcacaulis sp.]